MTNNNLPPAETGLSPDEVVAGIEFRFYLLGSLHDRIRRDSDANAYDSLQSDSDEVETGVYVKSLVPDNDVVPEIHRSLLWRPIADGESDRFDPFPEADKRLIAGVDQALVCFPVPKGEWQIFNGIYIDVSRTDGTKDAYLVTADGLGAFRTRADLKKRDAVEPQPGEISTELFDAGYDIITPRTDAPITGVRGLMNMFRQGRFRLQDV